MLKNLTEFILGMLVVGLTIPFILILGIAVAFHKETYKT